ncbi:hypothetical protein [Methylobacterium sp. J-076]|nr:hypothetical protein [Methylobacterium sp. J-076]MCJ2012426.1 hypothetical protein [Methylobacterium sp. J-076]
MRRDSRAHVARFGPAIRGPAVLTHAMPPHNVTDMPPGARDAPARRLAPR